MGKQCGYGFIREHDRRGVTKSEGRQRVASGDSRHAVGQYAQRQAPCSPMWQTFTSPHHVKRGMQNGKPSPRRSNTLENSLGSGSPVPINRQP